MQADRAQPRRIFESSSDLYRPVRDLSGEGSPQKTSVADFFIQGLRLFRRAAPFGESQHADQADLAGVAQGQHVSLLQHMCGFLHLVTIDAKLAAFDDLNRNRSGFYKPREDQPLVKPLTQDLSLSAISTAKGLSGSILSALDGPDENVLAP
jgi:hypothetical protein